MRSAGIAIGWLCVMSLSSVVAADERSPFDLSDPQRVDAGKQRFNSSCVGYCHGSEGMGGRAHSFKGRGDDFDVEYAYRIIKNGRKGSGAVMPRWGETFSQEQIWELVAYLKFLSTQKE
ncbi:cytochrome c [Bradyrhizobium sp. JYMT SZCCT0428]|uniref:c-type cytochrome n=1 Tax=Bradyrhizobium sp. JYMT SZCCT0428 TaxID=2807673 RepID=UPI001BACFADE|nr:cytochrome c [Bradyrhizobium sp. JYMT SZCCT0428]